MASLDLMIPHQLPKDEALARIKGLLGKLKQEQKDKISNVHETWEGDTGTFRFTIQGFAISGSVNVAASAITIDANVPFAVSLFKGTIKDVITKKANELLAKK